MESTTKPVGGNDIPFQEIFLKDKTGKTKIAIWDKMVNTVEKNQVIKLSNCRVKLFDAEKKLSATTSTECEVFLFDLSSKWKHFNQDSNSRQIHQLLNNQNS